MPRNSEKLGIPSTVGITAKNVGDFLLYAAGKSDQIRSALVKSLVTLGTWFPVIPRMTDRELVNAIRVAELGASRHGHGTKEQSAWLSARQSVEALLRHQLIYRPPLLAEDVAAAKRTIRIAAAHFEVELSVLEPDLSRLERERDVPRKLNLILNKTPHWVRAKMLRRVRKNLQGIDRDKLHRGKRFGEHHHRVLAAIMLLHKCGVTKEKARQQVAEVLFGFRRKIEADSLRALETRYRKTCKPRTLGSLGDPHVYRALELNPAAVVSTAVGRPDAFVPPESLPLVWLEHLGQFLLDRRMQQKAPDFLADLLSPELKCEWQKIHLEFQKATSGKLG